MSIEDKLIFAVTPQTKPHGVNTLFVGISRGCFEAIKDGMTRTIDLGKCPGLEGLPIHVVVYGGENHAEVMKPINSFAKTKGFPMLDERRREFGIDIKGKQEDAEYTNSAIQFCIDSLREFDKDYPIKDFAMCEVFLQSMMIPK